MNEEQLAAMKMLLAERQAKRASGHKKVHRVGRLTLEDALAQVAAAQEGNSIRTDVAFDGWSEARIKAFQKLNENPNAYYYRFNAPGETQRTGKWTKVCLLRKFFILK